MTKRSRTPGGYEVGYGKPPAHTRFQKGKSGNPKGTPEGGGKAARACWPGSTKLSARRRPCATAMW
jgi:hypothetical protein